MGRFGAPGGAAGLPGFLLGVFAGSAATLILTTYWKISGTFTTNNASDSDDDDTCGDEEVEEEGYVENFLGELDANGIISSPHENGHTNLGRSNSILSDTLDTSFSSRQSLTIEEEPPLQSSSSSTCYADNPDSGTNYEVITEDWAADTEIIQQAKDFDEKILSKISSKEEMHMLLRRTRAVNALAHTLTLAKDEKDCYEQVSRLLVPLFRIDACAYALKLDSNNVIYKHVKVNKHEYAKILKSDFGWVRPLNETAAAFVAKTLKQYYCPRTKESPFPAVRDLANWGINTNLVTPILVNGDKFAGCIVTCVAREDGFGETDRMLIDNVATMLGAAIYSRRLRIASEISNKISREMLHSMIPSKVIDKIECFWDESTAEYQRRRSSRLSLGSSLGESEESSLVGDCSEIEDDRMNSTNNSIQRQRKRRKDQIRQSISAKVNLLNDMNKSELELDNVGMVIDTSAMELNSTRRALYAETVSNVIIIFTDIVKFSQVSLTMKPLKVMDMLQDLFSRFDVLCDRYGVQKLETIGDAYLCTAGLFDGKDANDKTNNTAVAALGMAKEMVREARRVYIPKKNQIQTLEIRVGIHIGEITCGVLGERLPKFTVFGNAVNLAARMEQTCLPSRIRVTKDFFDLLETEEYEQKEIVAVKNMGEVETYLLNPLASTRY